MDLMILLWVFFWTMIALCTSIYAGKLGRSAGGWFCFAFFFGGIFGLILLAILGPKESNTASEVRELEAQLRLEELKRLKAQGTLT
jgi:hypothetical protein